MEIYTIGHSSHKIDDFIDILKQHDIGIVADVRTYPGSKRYPQYNQVTLARVLKSHGIEYYHFRGLGGYREPEPNSPNTALDDEAFRGYADHMGTVEFELEVKKLKALAENSPTAIMCAEAKPAQCHRSLLSDALVLGGDKVKHIMSSGELKPHAVSKLAHYDENVVIYKSDTGEQLSLFE